MSVGFRGPHWQVIAELTASRSAAEIATVANVSERTVERVQVALGLREPKKRIVWTPELAAQCEQLLGEGLSFTEVARTVGINRKYIAKRQPGKGWSATECGQFAAHVRRTNRIANRNGVQLHVANT